MTEIISGIYMITNKINNKKYIGQSSNIYQRWTHHKSDLNNNRHHNCHLQSSWNKYGKDNFDFTILEECEENKLDIREQYWIQKYDSYNTGYNLDLGGLGIRGYKHTEEELNKMHRIQQPKIVLQFDLNFNFVKRWIGGASQINKTLKYTKECILLRCNHTILDEMTPYKNSYWIFEDEYLNKNFSWNNYLNNVSHKDEIPICQYDTNFNLIKEWKTHKELRELGYDTITILRICNHSGTRKTYKDYIWAYKGYDFSDGYFGEKQYQKHIYNCKKINMFKEKNGEVLKTFNSIVEACEFINKPHKFKSNICQSIAKGQRSAGYYWEYA